MKTGFNRRFAGQNATVYGHGTYFAVNASYSAHPTYSKPAADGSQLMFVARVLTGVYTLGSGDMKVPPPRSNSQPHDRCDSGGGQNRQPIDVCCVPRQPSVPRLPHHLQVRMLRMEDGEY
ncbi:protein mono-ADP-ribosyltransferase PARP15-like [Sparus aurata]|uniref:protein mono-ADP-ribosyltransferase PARP15-like n=1 Tax=Sparus aurata TaxID=8175 RepID=UPI0011C18CC2|nr:protein mono-ADP-ribosyltransferase PARP15-like [Sparus aurata]